MNLAQMNQEKSLRIDEKKKKNIKSIFKMKYIFDFDIINNKQVLTIDIFSRTTI